MRLSKSWFLGCLLSADTESERLCMASVVDNVSVLDAMSDECLKMDTMLMFLLICQCCHPELSITVISTNSAELSSSHGVELSSSKIWLLLLLAEVVGVHSVHMDCATKLHRLVCHQGCKHNEESPSLPATVAAGLPQALSSSALEKMSVRLADHFHRFGPDLSIPRHTRTQNLISTVDSHKPTSWQPSPSGSYTDDDDCSDGGLTPLKHLAQPYVSDDRPATSTLYETPVQPSTEGDRAVRGMQSGQTDNSRTPQDDLCNYDSHSDDEVYPGPDQSLRVHPQPYPIQVRRSANADAGPYSTSHLDQGLGSYARNIGHDEPPTQQPHTWHLQNPMMSAYDPSSTRFTTPDGPDSDEEIDRLISASSRRRGKGPSGRLYDKDGRFIGVPSSSSSSSATSGARTPTPLSGPRRSGSVPRPVNNINSGRQEEDRHSREKPQHGQAYISEELHAS
jgi:hypothetical protein